MNAPALPEVPPDGAGDGRLVTNIMYFARTLRAAGLPIGPGRVIEAIRAVRTLGVDNREDFYWCLHAVFVNRRDQRELFDQAFHVFWRNPRILERMMALILPTLNLPAEGRGEELSRRLADALRGDRTPGTDKEDEPEPEITIDAVMTYSDRELLQHQDFEKMSVEEVDAAKQAIRRMRLPIMDVPTRRFHPEATGTRVDMRHTLRATLRSGGQHIPLKRRTPHRRHPPLVILCDISGSMSRYSRMLLHFLHAVTSDRDRVHNLPVRNPAHEHYPLSAPTGHRSGAREGVGSRGGLGRGHAYRTMPQGFQYGLVPTGVGTGGGGAIDHGWTRPGFRRRARGPDGAPAQVLPAPHLAKPAVALR